MKKVPNSIRKELLAIANKPAGEIDYSDIPASNRKDWSDAVRGKFPRPNAILRSVMFEKSKRRRAD